MSRLRLAQVAPCAALALLAVAGPVAAGDAALNLVFDPPVGKVLHYRLDSENEMSAQGMTASMTVAAEATLQRVADKGENVIMEMEFSKIDASMRQGEQLQTLPIDLAGKKARATLTKRGKLLGVEPLTDLGTEQKGMLENLADAFFVEFPEKAVRPGDTWSQAVGQLEKTGGSGTFTFEKSGKKLGVDCAHITGNVKVENKQPELHGGGTIETDVATPGGYLVSGKGSISMQGEGPSIVQTFELKLVPEGAASAAK